MELSRFERRAVPAYRDEHRGADGDWVQWWLRFNKLLTGLSFIAATNSTGAKVVIWLLIFGLAGCGQSYRFHGTLYDPPQPAPTLAGANWDGSTFQLADQQGKVAVIFFGYSYCPDVCPLTLANLAQVYGQLGEQAEQLAVIFVSTDPDRDTPARLAAYVPAFHQAFYGLHIPPDQLEPIKKAYGVYAEAERAQGNSENYTVAHNEYLFIVDKSGALRVLLPATIPPANLRADLEYLLQS